MDEGRNFPLPVTQDEAWKIQVKPAPVARAVSGRPTFVTIATADHAAQSRIFARSARECHPDARLVVLVPGATEPPRTLEDLYDLVITTEQLSVGGLADIAGQGIQLCKGRAGGDSSHGQGGDQGEMAGIEGHVSQDLVVRCAESLACVAPKGKGPSAHTDGPSWFGVLG